MRALLAAVALATILPLSTSAFAAEPQHHGGTMHGGFHGRGGDDHDGGYWWRRHHGWGWGGPGVYIGPVYGYNYYRPLLSMYRRRLTILPGRFWPIIRGQMS
ncbi:hypothetical protein BZU93_24405 [Salmonella enterica subsp. enterica]|nr:hypothetical protein [Salmonella enterica subsp. enterica serovar Kottbus]EFG9152652.1 hypothetical protein [Escherichia coli]MIL09015.1 hypothetical protein [Salmonella enterica subsp. enterica serovar Enteritidis]